MFVCSTHIGTHSNWEDRYFGRCDATLMTAPWWERFSAVEHMTVKGSVLSVSRCDSGMPGLWIGSCWKWCQNLNRAPRRALHRNIRCPAHDAVLVWWVTVNPAPPHHAMSVGSWVDAACRVVRTQCSGELTPSCQLYKLQSQQRDTVVNSI